MNADLPKAESHAFYFSNNMSNNFHNSKTSTY